MATITAFIRTSVKKADKVNIRFRLTDGRDIQLFHKSTLTVDPSSWDSKKQEIKSKVIFKAEERTAFNDAVAERKKLIRSIYDSSQELTSELLDLRIDQKLFPEKYTIEETKEIAQSFFQAFDEFLDKHKLSKGRKSHFEVVKRALQRYELYRKIKLEANSITPDTIRDIEVFMRDELSVYKEFPEIYKEIQESRTPIARGQNTVSGMLVKLRTFCIWMVDEEKATKNPFKKFSIQQAIYGSPFYISNEERNKLYKKDLSRKQELSIQRDIFVFQCLIGCRVGDLYKLTTRNIIDGYLEYIARKTKEGHPVTVRVPLNETAKEILKKYPTMDGEPLLPFITEQHYNLAIREAFTIAGLKRIVTVINPTTREPETRPLNEIASSHLARRSFIGNIYKQVKDPNLVSSLSGHKEGSLAFARYREIDDEMKQDLVKHLG